MNEKELINLTNQSSKIEEKKTKIDEIELGNPTEWIKDIYNKLNEVNLWISGLDNRLNKLEESK